jgi:hypothetical protein
LEFADPPVYPAKVLFISKEPLGVIFNCPTIIIGHIHNTDKASSIRKVIKLRGKRMGK